MAESPDDAWTAWLSEQRFSGGSQEERLKETLQEYRDTVLDNADIRPGDTVLDVGAGDGLIAFGALERVGSTGRVIFADISETVLEQSKTTAEELGLTDQCEFVIAPAEELEPIEAESVDAITLRSVLIFVRDKERAFSEFFRVLTPGGRLSINEPIGEFTKQIRSTGDIFLQYDMERTDLEVPDDVRQMYRRMREYGRKRSPEHDTAMDFNDRDLFEHAEKVGFEDVHLTLHAYHYRITETEDWEAWVTTSFGPDSPTKREAMEAVLSPEEQDTFKEHVRPLLETPAPKDMRGTPSYLWATKPAR